MTEAFAEAEFDGLDADCMAQAALFAAFMELVATYGEDAVAEYAARPRRQDPQRRFFDRAEALNARRIDTIRAAFAHDASRLFRPAGSA